MDTKPLYLTLIPSGNSVPLGENNFLDGTKQFRSIKQEEF